MPRKKKKTAKDLLYILNRFHVEHSERLDVVLEEAVRIFNKENGTKHTPEVAVRKYFKWMESSDA